MTEQLINKYKLKIANLKQQLSNASDIQQAIIRHQMLEIELFIFDLKLLQENQDESL